MELDVNTGEINENTPGGNGEMGVSEQSTGTGVDAGTEVAQVDPVEEASEKFTKLLPYVKKIAEASESKGSLVRVLHAFAEFPLGSGKPRLLNQNEKMLFSILQEMQGYKSTILQAFLKQNLQKMQDESKGKQENVENRE